MTQNDTTLELIKKALEMTTPGVSEKVTMDTHLVADGILDSLDLMNFMFELEDLHGHKIEQIDETFDDYRVSVLAGFLQESQA